MQKWGWVGTQQGEALFLKPDPIVFDDSWGQLWHHSCSCKWPASSHGIWFVVSFVPHLEGAQGPILLGGLLGVSYEMLGKEPGLPHVKHMPQPFDLGLLSSWLLLGNENVFQD